MSPSRGLCQVARRGSLVCPSTHSWGLMPPPGGRRPLAQNTWNPMAESEKGPCRAIKLFHSKNSRLGQPQERVILAIKEQKS